MLDRLLWRSAASAAYTLAVVVLFAVCGSAHATNYFSWGAEGITGTNKPLYGSQGYDPNSVVLKSNTTIDCAVKHSGSCSMRITVNGLGTNETVGLDPASYQYFPTQFAGAGRYYRWWWRIDSGFDWGDGSSNRNPRMKAGRWNVVADGNNRQFFTGVVAVDGFGPVECDAPATNTPGGHYGVCLKNTGAAITDSTVIAPFDMNTMADSQWHEYIVYIKANTSVSCTAGTNCDGQFKVWIDGSLVSQHLNFRLGDNDGQFYDHYPAWMISPYVQFESSYSAGGTWYLDDFSTDDTWNSTFGGGDTTAPTGVAVTVPSTGATVSGNQTVRATCTDETAVANVQMLLDGSNLGSADTSSPYSITWDTTTASNASHTLSARCTDTSSNQTTSSTISVTVSNIGAQSRRTWIWCDDFETDKSASWWDSNGFGSSMVRSAGNGNPGYSLRATFPNTTGSSQAGDWKVMFGDTDPDYSPNVKSSTDVTEIYWRAYIRNSANWQPDTGWKLARAVGCFDSTVVPADHYCPSQSFSAHWWSAPGSNSPLLSVDPASGVSGSTVVADNEWNDFANYSWLGQVSGTTQVMSAAKANTWQCIEGRVKLNTLGASDGVQELWVDGVLEAQATGLNLRGSYAGAYNGINLMSFENFANSGLAITGRYRDWDNVVIATDRVGCALADSGDTTAPTVPASLSCPSSTTTGITCTWSASTDEIGVTSYPLERRSLPDGGAWTQIAAPAGTSYADTVPATTRYEYRVSARDAAGNQSSPSTSATATSHINLSFGYGVNLPLEFRNGAWDSTQRAQALDAIAFMCGSTCWVRMDVTHSTVEATQGVYTWSEYDTRINEIKARGFKILLMLGYSPAWNRDVACTNSNAMPVNGAAFGAFAGAAVARFTPDAVEFWNEPNSLGFSCPAVSATNYYAKVLEPGYNAVKSARPQTAVITAGTGPTVDAPAACSPGSACTESRRRWVIW
ncbi:MAG: hypothetical protein IPM06_18820 [Rhizobiales bacterium]|nr:hypothetical protein [Hyphomicrobiales bacterium]